MLNKEFKRRLAYEALIFLGLMALLLFITRIWALLFPVIFGIFIAALRLLFKRAERAEVIIAATIPPPEPKPETEKDLLRRAFGLIQRRVTEDVESLHPFARWQWLTPGALARIENDEPVTIILNGAGGYQKAIVRIHNLTYKGLVFETAPTLNTTLALPVGDNPPVRAKSPEDGDAADPTVQEEPVNYEYLAFEWVDAHLLRLNERGNEAIGRGYPTFLIPADELPDRDSWPAICAQLMANDFEDAVAHTGGILISLQQ